jgi:hypothetical protein
MKEEEDNSKHKRIRSAIDKLLPKLANGEITYWYFTYPLEKEFGLDFNDIETYSYFTPKEREILNQKYVAYQVIRSYWKFVERNPYVNLFFNEISNIIKTKVTPQNFETVLKPYLPKRAITTIRKRLEKNTSS